MKKQTYLEVIRILALICIIFNHTGEYGYLLFQTTGNEALRILSICVSNFCKIGVPLFFMISGALLLPKQESLKDLFLKRILRLVVVLVLFSFIYYIRLYLQHPEYGFSLFFFVKLIYAEPFITPFWFLYSYLAFLLMLPLLRRMVKTMSEQDFLYFGIGAFLLLFLIKIPEYVFESSINISIPLLTTNILFPLLGYYIAYHLPEGFTCRKNHLMLLLLFFINSFCCIAMTLYDFSRKGSFAVVFIEEFTLIPAFTIFYFIKYLWSGKTEKAGAEKIILYIGGCTFCTYLFEEMLRIDIFMKLLDKRQPSGMSLLLCIPYIAAILCTGVFISTILKRIPVVRWLKL